MMSKLDRYIAKTLIINTSLVLLVLLGLFLFFGFIEEADDISETYTTLHAAQYVFLHTPQRIYEIFPMAVLMGTLLGLGMLANTNELVVMRAAGLSLGRIVWAVLKAGGLLLIVVILLGEKLAPYTSQQAKNLRSIARSGQIIAQGGQAFWLRDGNFFINIQRVLPEQQVADVYVYEVDQARRLKSMSYARHARYHEGRWVLRDISQTLFSEKNTAHTVHNDTLEWRSELNPDLLNILVLKPKDLSTPELYTYIKYLKRNNQGTASYEAALWARILYPALCAVMVLTAVPFVFGSLRSVAVGRRILTGTLIGICFYILNETATRAGLLYNFNPLAGALLPLVLFFGFSLVMLRRRV